MIMQNDTFYEIEPLETGKPVTSNLQSPWRRFFARGMDLFIYNAIWGIFLTFVMNVNVSIRSQGAGILDTIVAFSMMLLLEPLMLALFGTTPGKWILGLRVEDHDGRYLYYTEGLSRTWTVILRGFGLNIPFYRIYRQWKSYSACKEGETLDWEHDSVLILADQKHRRTVTYIGINVAIFIGLIFVLNLGAMPKHKGDITIAEFSENYNKLADYFDVEGSHELDASGNWVMRESESNVLYIGGEYGYPKFEFEEQNGYNPFTSWLNDAIKSMARSPFESFSHESDGITVWCDISYTGYHEATDFGSLWPMENVESAYTFEFTMIKE